MPKALFSHESDVATKKGGLFESFFHPPNALDHPFFGVAE